MAIRIINKDYTYCSGVCCKIKKECKRYLENPPDEPLFWTSPEYNEDKKDCKNFEKKIELWK
jgi:hypothetical protein